VTPPKLLPLYRNAKPCQRSGYCCEQGPCPFGTWDAEAKRCAELSYDADGKAVCGKFADITALPWRMWWAAPSFGSGCCSPMNPKRVQSSAVDKSTGV